MPAPALPADDWSRRWPDLARASGLAPDEPVLLALSGGADSVLLLHWLAAARPAARVRAAHVDHGLRGAESAADARFAADLCRSLGVPLALLRAELDPDAPGLEARAREERYRLLAEEARSSGHRTILTGHHSDDALETVLMRWARGTELAGLRGPRTELRWNGGASGSDAGADPVRVVRPLLTLRREEVRALLAGRGLAWREDSSNADPRFTRTRVRHGVLPLVRELGGPEAVEELRAFSDAVESLESEFARATAHVTWRPVPFAAATRTARERPMGGVVPRGELMALPPPLARRVLWRLLTEGTGRSPSRTVLERLLADLRAGRTRRYSLPRRWSLLLRARELVLVPPARKGVELVPPGSEHQLWLPFPSEGPAGLRPPTLPLPVPGSVTLPDGRRISAERVEVAPGTDVLRSGLEVELDSDGIGGPLGVRFPAPGDRFRPLGGPGSKSLARFLAGRGVAREERAHVPLVTWGPEILWVGGLAPAEPRRVRPRTERRLRLVLHPG